MTARRAPCSPPGRPGARRGQGGFSLVELMVSLTLTGILLAAVYNMFISSTTVFQTQEEVAGAQYQLVTGMDRLISDLRRAGYGATPNSDIDPYACTVGGLRVQGLAVQEGAGKDEIKFNSFILPDELTITGNFSTAKPFPALANAINKRVTLQVSAQSGANPYDAGATLLSEADFRTLFTPGRLVALRNSYGYTLIAPVATANYPTLTFDSLSVNGRPRCTIEGTSSMVEVNPVDKVRYRIVRAYPQVENSSATRLLRELVDKDDNVITGSEMVVTENAVDLQVWFMFRDGQAGNNVIVADQDPTDASSNLAIKVDGTIQARPDFIRSAMVRLAVRTELDHSEILHRPRNGDGDRLLTFDVDGQPDNGAAPVLLLTAETEVPNFSLRDLTLAGGSLAAGGN